MHGVYGFCYLTNQLNNAIDYGSVAFGGMCHPSLPYPLCGVALINSSVLVRELMIRSAHPDIAPADSAGTRRISPSRPRAIRFNRLGGYCLDLENLIAFELETGLVLFLFPRPRQ